MTLAVIFFFFNDTATTEIYTLSLHDALPISRPRRAAVTTAPAQERLRRLGDASVLRLAGPFLAAAVIAVGAGLSGAVDRKSTRLNSSHANISYAVFCLKKNSSK